MNKTVMFVDDENFILKSLKRLMKRQEFNSVYMNSGKEALEYLESNSVDLIVTDIRMPDMDGFELLSIVKEKYPKILRVALSGFTESKTIYKLIEKNVAKIYLFKPWDNFELKKNINRILEFEDILTDYKLLELINNIDSLPVLPKLYQDIKRLMDADASIEEIGKVVEMDQGISSKVLRLANSAFYGRKTGNITEAIMGIGFNNLKNMVLASSIFSGSKTEMEYLDRMWQHAINTNKLTLMIYEKLLDKKMPTIYGSAGLLHDIGKVILHLFYSESYTEIVKNADSEDNNLINLELDAYNVTHQEVGAYLMNWWELPHAYVETAMYHHRPSDERVVNYELVAVVHLANYYSLKTVDLENVHGYLDSRVFTKLDIKKEDVEALLDELD